ncbi:MAG: tRNA preQ1(34) S-adenosylmethionine ribosyltransferase-isomerase QueA [Spirochaetia bacterium]|nr:tRNA preQ1(34) S-adenosylmethionine ribosyltransferase-isomerase QueA [Spirochaetales bacterium]MDX9783677.1 tRNA preQ1(34) S-adenosylmethionine ribosyltransferase-isomerase QueA [Spirochaetia bacterium]
MKTEDFNFELPQELIAQYPAEKRGSSRLLVLDRSTGRRTHAMIGDLPSFIDPGSLMVFNDSKVRKARLYGIATDTGAKVEFLLLHPAKEGLNEEAPSSSWTAMSSKSRKQRVGRQFMFPEKLLGRITALLPSGEKIVGFDRALDDEYLERNGHIPLPPYIRREDEAQDAERYQTVYARVIGSAASPTAGLHFTPEILEKISDSGVGMEWVTLHVGLGTFLPVRVDTIEEHQMHREWYSVPERTALAVKKAKNEGRKLIAVGTTSARTLESAWDGTVLRSGPASTDIFLYPGRSFSLIDQLFTNFHTPKSTLLMLVSAFAGRELILETYEEAIREGYRFFSYGDAMLIR